MFHNIWTKSNGDTTIVGIHSFNGKGAIGHQNFLFVVAVEFVAEFDNFVARLVFMDKATTLGRHHFVVNDSCVTRISLLEEHDVIRDFLL